MASEDDNQDGQDPDSTQEGTSDPSDSDESDDGDSGEESDDGDSGEESDDGDSGEESDDGDSGEESDDDDSGEESDDDDSGEESDDDDSGEESDDSGEESDDDDDVAEDRPMEPHSVLVADQTWVEVLIYDEFQRPVPDIPLSIVADDGSSLDQSTDETGLARWDDVPHDLTWQLTSSEAVSDMRREATLQLISFNDDDQDDDDQDDDSGDADSDSDGEDNSGSSLLGGDSPAPSSDSDSGGGLFGTVKRALGFGDPSPAAPSKPAQAQSSSDDLFGSIGKALGFGGGDDVPVPAAAAAAHVPPIDAGPLPTHLAVVEKVEIKPGDTLDLLAAAANLSLDDLCLFNWGTSDPDELNDKLESELGYTQNSETGELVPGDEGDAGSLYVPKPLSEAVELGTRYVLRGKAIRPTLPAVTIRLFDLDWNPISHISYEVTGDGGFAQSGVSENGEVTLHSPPPTCVVRWSRPDDVRLASRRNSDAPLPQFEYEETIFLRITKDDPDEAAGQRLNNLGHGTSDNLPDAVRSFQLFAATDLTGNIDDIRDDLAQRHDQCDLGTPAFVCTESTSNDERVA